MALDFPSNPVEGETYSSDGTSWKFVDGVWAITSGTSDEFLPLVGGTVTGPLILDDTLNVNGGAVFDAQATFRNFAAVFNAGLRSLADIAIRLTGDKFLRFQAADGTDQAQIGWNSTDQELVIISSGVEKFRTSPTGIEMPLDLDVTGNITMGGELVLTEADIDGYLPLTGGTVSGSLAVQGSLVAALDGFPQIQIQRSSNPANQKLSYIALNAPDGDLQFVHRNDDASPLNLPLSLRRDGNVETANSLLVGTSSPNGPASNGINGIVLSGGNHLISVQRDGGSALQVGRAQAGGVANWYQNSNNCGTVAVSGGNTTNYGTSSDPRMKGDYKPIDIALFTQIRFYDFAWTVGEGRGMGVRADELQQIVPHAVTGTVDEIDADGNPVYMSVDYAKLVPLLGAKIQAQDEIISNLLARIEALETA